VGKVCLAVQKVSLAYSADMEDASLHGRLDEVCIGDGFLEVVGVNRYER
jgi:hypothetical protein